ncbi:hypothetical protein LI328DRAFT_132357 [Trichoderma asperelloides]|nr:hypothetical protein LI328DRAFT_132357 [Trichoderma asperelloides]
MQPVNFNHASCPKCSAAMDSGSKTCSKCGAVSLLPGSSSSNNVFTTDTNDRLAPSKFLLDFPASTPCLVTTI